MYQTGSKKNAGFLVVKWLHRYIHQVVFHLSPRNLFLLPPRLYFRPERCVCRCGKGLTVLKTYVRSLASLTIGEFQAHITQLTCLHCHKTYDSEELQAIVAPNGKFAFDVMVYVGEALFLHARNEKEIQRELSEKISASPSGKWAILASDLSFIWH